MRETKTVEEISKVTDIKEVKEMEVDADDSLLLSSPEKTNQAEESLEESAEIICF